MKKCSKNEILILNCFKSLSIPQEVLYNDNPDACGEDIMVFYEELVSVIDCVLKNLTISSSFVFDKKYEIALNKLIQTTNINLNIFANLALLSLQIIKLHILSCENL